MAVTEGTVPFRGFRTWYQVVGELLAPDGKLPLLVVNGGPGCAHDYLEDLASLADESGRPVVFYDQLGCGRSDHPDDPALWVMDTFVEEFPAVRAALGLTGCPSSAIHGAARWPSGMCSAGRPGWSAWSWPPPWPALRSMPPRHAG